MKHYILHPRHILKGKKMSEIDWDTPDIAVRYDKNCDHQYLKGQSLVEMMGISNGDTVLDVGCGTGRQAVYVSGIIGSSGRLTGIDPSSHRIELAQEKFARDPKGNARFLVGQAEDLSSVPLSQLTTHISVPHSTGLMTNRGHLGRYSGC